MKPLTIDELKALKAGDWIWAVEVESQGGIYTRLADKNDRRYLSILSVFNMSLTTIEAPIEYESYGKEWIAYKNKEQAEAKGEIVNVPCNIGDTVYFVEHYKPKIIEAKVSMIQQKADKSWVIRYTYYSNVYQQNCTHNCKDSDVGTKLFTDKAEAEKKLAELKGEQQ